MISEIKKNKIAGYSIATYAFSVIGSGKIENQDSLGIFSDDYSLIIVVADGLGSAAYSKEGSAKIVDMAIEILSQTSDYDMVPNMLLKQWRSGLNGNINQYDTTVKFIKITKDEIICGGVGDGWIALLDRANLLSMTAEHSFSNQTDTILSFDLKDKFWVNRYDIATVTSGLISTDGFSEDMDKENGDKLLIEIEQSIKSNEESFVKEMCATLEKWPVETNKDDKTVVFLTINKEDN